MNNGFEKYSKKLILMGTFSVVIGIILFVVGAFDLLEQDGIIRSILYVFGAGVGRMLICGLGVMITISGIYFLRYNGTQLG